MVLGDSHYGSVTSPSITKDVLAQYLNPNIEREGWMNTFLKFERSLVGKETTKQDSQTIWSSLLFYNYLQVLLDGPREAGTDQQYQDSEDAFFQVLEEYQPEILIVWGKRLWKKLPYKNWEEGDPVFIDTSYDDNDGSNGFGDGTGFGGGRGSDNGIGDRYGIDNGYYKLKSGRVVRTFCVYHPSAGYDWRFWHNVIKHFVSMEREISNTISQVGFQNFRRFTEFPPMDLGNVNYLIGGNNAGKSTFDKATILFFDFLKNWFATSSITLNFTSERSKELGITSFNEAFSYYAKEDDKLVFEMTIGRYSYQVIFNHPATKNENSSNTEKEIYTSVSANQISIVDNLDNYNLYQFKYDEGSNEVKATAEMSVFSPSKAPIVNIERYVNSYRFNANRKGESKAQIYSYIDTINKDIEELNFSETTINAFNSLKELLGEETPTDLLISLDALKDAIQQTNNGYPLIHVTLPLQRTASFKDFTEKLKDINELQKSVDEGRANNVMSRDIDYVGIIDIDMRKKTFSIFDDSNSFSRIVIDYYLDGQKSDEAKKFVNYWLKEFQIGESVSFEHLGNEVFSVKVKLIGIDHEAPVTSLGLGSIQLTALILKVANSIRNGAVFSNKLLIFEEPERGLHPNRQSKLADFFLDIYERFGIQVIVETHSEYLIRKTQVIVAEQDYKNENDIKEHNPFMVYFFEPNASDRPRGMDYAVSGAFKEKFGEGFFDEAPKWDMTIIRKEFELKKKAKK